MSKNKNKRQEVVLVIRADKPITKAEAVAMVRDCVHGDFYPDDRMSDASEFTVVTAKRVKDVKP